MKERIQELLTRFGYSATRLADEIGVQRSGISHILSGRNQPSFDFLVKLLKRFPDINAEWLLRGKGMMSGTQPNNESPNLTFSPQSAQDLFSIPQTDTTQVREIKTPETIVTNVAGITRIILLNSDGTFEVYHQSGNN